MHKPYFKINKATAIIKQDTVKIDKKSSKVYKPSVVINKATFKLK